MRHRISGRKLGRKGEHRLALMRNLSTALLDREKITTTLAKAKELRGFTERLVTLSKRETLHARRQVMRHIHDRAVVAKLFDTLSARYAQRPGGYTRVIKLGPRRGDNAEMAIIELVGSDVTGDDAADEKPKRKKKAAAKPKGESAGSEGAAAPKGRATKKGGEKVSTKKAGASVKKSASANRKSS